MNIQRYAIGVRYIGSNLCGFTASADNTLPSVENLVCNSLTSLLHGGTGSDDSARNANKNHCETWSSFRGSSRTDAGVHAHRNVFTVDITRSDNKPAFTPEAIANGLNYYLTKQTSKYSGNIAVDSTRNSYKNQSNLRSVIITDAQLVPNDFNVREAATSRLYEYRILVPTIEAYATAKRRVQYRNYSVDEVADLDAAVNIYGSKDSATIAKDSLLLHRYLFEENRAWCLSKPLDVTAMQLAADLLRNDSKDTDYSSFRNSGCQSKSPIRKILNLEIKQVTASGPDLLPGEADMIIITVEATSFLLRMVRNIVAVLVHVGQGLPASGPQVVSEYLALKSRNAIKLKPAPAEGLYLRDVIYDGISYRPTSDTSKK
jgi:tRNA pseudouridine(38-40) synthase